MSLPADFPPVSSDRVLAGKTKKPGKTEKRGAPVRPQRSGLHEPPQQTYAAGPMAAGQPLVGYVRKVGDSFALLMSPSLLERAGLSEGWRVEIEPLDDGRLVVSRSKRRFTLDEIDARLAPLLSL